jgi:hypothetical protein
MNWASLIKDTDAEPLWKSLHKLISSYLLAIELCHDRFEASPVDLSALLTQELFLELISKHRFERYIESGYTSAEIESELLAVEIPCLLLSRLGGSTF